MYKELLRGATSMSWRPIYFLRLLMLCLCGLFLLLIAFSSRAFAASNPITITYQTNAVHFPGSIDFTMTANDRDMPISQATLFISFKDTPDAVQEQDKVTISPPHQSLDLRKQRGLSWSPPSQLL